MANEQKQTIRISKEGVVRGLETPLVNAVADRVGGQKDIARASHVDVGRDLTQEALGKLFLTYSEQRQHAAGLFIKPEYASKWFADMGPVSGPVLGPFDSRTEALEAEEKWLLDHGIPLPEKLRQ